MRPAIQHCQSRWQTQLRVNLNFERGFFVTLDRAMGSPLSEGASNVGRTICFNHCLPSLPERLSLSA
jgi:hypothetical protein